MINYMLLFFCITFFLYIQHFIYIQSLFFLLFLKKSLISCILYIYIYIIKHLIEKRKKIHFFVIKFNIPINTFIQNNPHQHWKLCAYFEILFHYLTRTLKNWTDLIIHHQYPIIIIIRIMRVSNIFYILILPRV